MSKNCVMSLPGDFQIAFCFFQISSCTEIDGFQHKRVFGVLFVIAKMEVRLLDLSGVVYFCKFIKRYSNTYIFKTNHTTILLSLVIPKRV